VARTKLEKVQERQRNLERRLTAADQKAPPARPIDTKPHDRQ
jgi:BMFP domain-containing protein YqiC